MDVPTKLGDALHYTSVSIGLSTFYFISFTDIFTNHRTHLPWSALEGIQKSLKGGLTVLQKSLVAFKRQTILKISLVAL